MLKSNSTQLQNHFIFIYLFGHLSTPTPKSTEMNVPKTTCTGSAQASHIPDHGDKVIGWLGLGTKET